MGCVMTKQVKVNVSYREGVGYVSEANHAITRSVTALSLEGLRKRITVAVLLGRRSNEQIAVTLDLDPTAQAEHDRRPALSGVRDGAARPHTTRNRVQHLNAPQYGSTR